jgi:oligopeptide transport system ATP-binding protein
MPKKKGMAVILVTHDLGVIAGTCDDVLVMYAGRICESASARDLFARQCHPYTKALLNSLPSMNTDGKELYSIPGMPPDLTRPIQGCPFAARCEHAHDRCRAGSVRLQAIESSRATACIRVKEIAL